MADMFIGRQKYIKDIKWQMTGSRIIVITGAPGIGKTSLVKKIVEETEDQFEGVFWKTFLYVPTSEELIYEFEQFVSRYNDRSLTGLLNSHLTLKYQINTLTNSLNRKYLLIFDDFEALLGGNGEIKDEALDNFFSSLLQSDLLSRIIIISKRLPALYHQIEGKYKLSLRGLTLSETSELLSGLSLEVDEGILPNIHKRTKGHPLSLLLFSALAQVSSIEELLKDIEDPKKSETYLIDKIYGELSLSERELLNQLAIVRKPLPEEELKALSPSDSEVDILSGKYLLDRDIYGLYYEHHLVKRYIHNKLEKEEKKSLHKQVGRFYHRRLKKARKNPSDLREWLEAHYHYLRAEEFDDAANMLNVIARNLRDWGYLELGMKLLKRTAEKSKGWLKGTMYHWLGMIYQIQGRYEEAKEVYNKSLRIYKRHNYQRGLSGIYDQLGIFHTDRGHLDEALSYFEQALKIDRESLYWEGEANQLGNIGNIYRYRGEINEAKSYFEESLEVSRQIGYEKGEAAQSTNLGMMNVAMGNLEEALKHLKQARELHHKINQRQEEADNLGNIGLILSALGKLREAKSYFEQALEIDHQNGYRQAEADDLTNIGRVSSALGDLNSALNYYRRALDIHHQLGYQQGEMDILGYIGGVYVNLGILEEAMRYYKKALELHHKFGYKRAEADDLSNLGEIYSGLGDADQAINYYQRAFRVDQEIGNREGEARDLVAMAVLHRRKGDIEDALKLYNTALQIHRDIEFLEGQAADLSNIGLIYRDLGDLKSAQVYLSQALETIRRSGNLYGEAITLGNLGLIYSAEGKYEEALNYYQSSRKINQLLGNTEIEASDLNNIGKVYETMEDIRNAYENYRQALKLFLNSDSPYIKSTYNNLKRLVNSKSLYDTLAPSERSELEQLFSEYDSQRRRQQL